MSIQYPLIIGPTSLGALYDANQISLVDSKERLDATDEYASMAFCINQTQQINKVGFYVAVISGTSSAYLISLETLNVSGVPSGSNYGGSSGTVYLCNQFVQGWNWIDLSTPATGTAGNLVAARVRCIGGASSTDYLVISNHLSYRSDTPRYIGSGLQTQAHPPFAIQYSDNLVQGLPISGYSNPSFTSSNDPDEMGMKFTVPMPMTCEGADITATFGGNANFRILLYQEDAVIRVVDVVDEDRIASTLTTAKPSFKVYWPIVELQENTNYRITIQPYSSNAELYEYTLTTGTYRYVYPGGTYFSETYRTSSGSFTDDPQKFLWMSPMMSHISPSTGTAASTTIIAGEGAHAWAY